MSRRQTIPAEARERLQRILGALRGAKGMAEKMTSQEPDKRDHYPLTSGVYGMTIELAANDLEQVLEGFAPRPRAKRSAEKATAS